MNTAELNGKQYAVTVEGSRLILDEITPEVKGLWRPVKRNESYWSVRSQSCQSGDTVSSKFNASPDTTAAEIAMGNVFQSREAAAKASPLMARANKIIAAALQADPDAGAFVARERTFTAYREDGMGAWKDAKTSGDIGSVTACVHTKEQALEMARILNEEGVK